MNPTRFRVAVLIISASIGGVVLSVAQLRGASADAYVIEVGGTLALFGVFIWMELLWGSSDRKRVDIIVVMLLTIVGITVLIVAATLFREGLTGGLVEIGAALALAGFVLALEDWAVRNVDESLPSDRLVVRILLWLLQAGIPTAFGRALETEPEYVHPTVYTHDSNNVGDPLRSSVTGVDLFYTSLPADLDERIQAVSDRYLPTLDLEGPLLGTPSSDVTDDAAHGDDEQLHRYGVLSSFAPIVTAAGGEIVPLRPDEVGLSAFSDEAIDREQSSGDTGLDYEILVRLDPDTGMIELGGDVPDGEG